MPRMQSLDCFRIAFIALYLAMLLLRSYYGRRARRNGESSWALHKDIEDREGSFAIFIRGFLFVLMLGLFIIYIEDPAWFSQFNISSPPWVRIVGILISFSSLPLLIWTHEALGREWSTNLRILVLCWYFHSVCKLVDNWVCFCKRGILIQKDFD